jgi:hypothetical protein
VAAAMKRPPGRTLRSDGSSPTNRCERMKTASNCGEGRVPANDCDWAESGNGALATESRRPREGTTRRDFFGDFAITILPTENHVESPVIDSERRSWLIGGRSESVRGGKGKL